MRLAVLGVLFILELVAACCHVSFVLFADGAIFHSPVFATFVSVLVSACASFTFLVVELLCHCEGFALNEE